MGFEQLTTRGYFYMEPDIREVRKPPTRWREPVPHRTRVAVIRKTREPVSPTPKPVVIPEIKPPDIEWQEEAEACLNRTVAFLENAPMTKRFKQINQLHKTLLELLINKRRKTSQFRIAELEVGLADAVSFLKDCKQTWRYTQLRQIHDDFVILLAKRGKEGVME
jgi:hypothetical protein